MKRRSFISSSTKINSNVPYWFIGINISSSVRKLEAALVGVSGAKVGAEIFSYKSVAFDLPSEMVNAYDSLKLTIFEEKTPCENEVHETRTIPGKCGRPSTNTATNDVSCLSLIKLAELKIMLTAVQEEAISELLNETNVSRASIVAVVVSSPCFRIKSSLWPDQYARIGLNDAPALSSKTGFNIVDALDCYCDSLSRYSILSLPYWILLGTSEKNKLIIELGETARWRYLPSSKTDKKSWKNIRYNDICVCGSLLNILTKQASKGKMEIDVGGKLSVQGQCVSELLDYWHTGIAHNSEKMERNSLALDNNYYIDSLLKFEPKMSSVDVLCSAVHWIADSITKSVQSFVSTLKDESYDIVLTGSAKQNGLLFNRLFSNFGAIPLHFLNEYGDYLEDSFDAIAVGILGELFISGNSVIQHNIDDYTNKRSLGCLTVGGVQNSWNLLMKFQNEK